MHDGGPIRVISAAPCGKDASSFSADLTLVMDHARNIVDAADDTLLESILARIT
ncbi:MAG: hypothetical protein Q6373_026140 [Candidatus Sigynarchaeota archaeon]